MDTYITATEARQRFLQLLNEVQQGDQVIVTRHGTPAAVLIDFERLETLKSLARLWQDPEALRAMREANEQVSGTGGSIATLDFLYLTGVWRWFRRAFSKEKKEELKCARVNPRPFLYSSFSPRSSYCSPYEYQ